VCDLGPGAFSNLRRFGECSQLDAVVITHMHADHFMDLVMLRNALKYGERRRESRLPVYLPASGEGHLHAIGLAVGSDSKADFFQEVFEIHPYDAQSALSIADFRLTFARTVHYIDAYAIRVQRGDASITYSADTAPCADVVALAANSNLFICESTLGPDGSEDGVRGHSSGREAASMAREAHVEKLLLTHYGSELSPQGLKEEAQRHFNECAVADDLMKLRVHARLR